MEDHHGLSSHAQANAKEAGGRITVGEDKASDTADHVALPFGRSRKSLELTPVRNSFREFRISRLSQIGWPQIS
jgi:hypothetical protein